MAHKHGVSTGANSFLGVAFHQTELFQTVGHQTANGEVNIPPLHTRLGYLKYVVVASLYDGIDLELTLVVVTAHRGGTGVVRAIVVDSLGTGVAKHQTASLQLVHRGRAVHDLAMLCQDGSKTDHRTQSVGDTVESTGNFLLCDTRAAHLHGCRVHLIANDGGTLQFLDFFISLHRTHLHDSLDQVHGCTLFLLIGMDAEQIEYLNLYVCTVRRQEMDAALLTHGVVADGLQRLHRRRVLHTDLHCHVVYTFYRTIPYDIVDTDVVADECLNIIIHINDTHESVTVQTEIIQE